MFTWKTLGYLLAALFVIGLLASLVFMKQETETAMDHDKWTIAYVLCMCGICYYCGCLLGLMINAGKSETPIIQHYIHGLTGGEVYLLSELQSPSTFDEALNILGEGTLCDMVSNGFITLVDNKIMLTNRAKQAMIEFEQAEQRLSKFEHLENDDV